MAYVPEMTSTPIRTYLQSAIRPYHQEAESGRLGRLRAKDLSAEEYDRILAAFYAIHQFLANQISPECCVPWSRYFLSALRMNALSHDIGVRGIRVLDEDRRSVANAFSAFAHPSQKSTEAVAGFAYVMVGSLLGARVIRKALKNSLQLNEYSGASFFCSEKGEGQLQELPNEFFKGLENESWSAQQIVEIGESAAQMMGAISAFWNSDDRY